MLRQEFLRARRGGARGGLGGEFWFGTHSDLLLRAVVLGILLLDDTFLLAGGAAKGLKGGFNWHGGEATTWLFWFGHGEEGKRREKRAERATTNN
jgi:hypothetical protein